jgi:hypothetical protein
LLLLIACSPESGDGGGVDSGPRRDAGPIGVDAGRDAGAMMCASAAECDDGVMCTIDNCAVGGVCRHVGEDSRCPDGQRCSPTMGCTDEGCKADVDCDDGTFCNGTERCVAMACIPGTMRDCDDGNSCTMDRCDATEDRCRYETICDAGPVGPPDGGMAGPFDPTMHYTGTFLVAPAPSLGCPPASYSLSRGIMFAIRSGALEVQADRFLLRQMPAPTDENFDVSTSDGCMSVRLRGTFRNADEFDGTWTTTTSGACGSCPSQNIMLVGARS